MGNRAVITIWDEVTEGFNPNNIGVYLHWNGGRDSVQAFLCYCWLKGYRQPENDCYGWARLCQVISNFFGGTNSIGIDTCNRLHCDNYDNGTYLIKGWRIVGRKYFEWEEQNDYDLFEMLQQINKRQPTEEQISDDLLETGCKKYLEGSE